MAKLVLQFEDHVVKEYAVGMMATIGRLSENTVVIDSPAVSSHHACVVRDGDQFVVEDLQSTNGTFVNGMRVSRQALQYGDVVLVGKHQLLLDRPVGGEPAARRDLGQSGMKSLVVWALSDNEPAVAFYQALGGRAVARSSEKFGDKLLEKVAFSWN